MVSKEVFKEECVAQQCSAMVLVYTRLCNFEWILRLFWFVSKENDGRRQMSAHSQTFSTVFPVSNDPVILIPVSYFTYMFISTSING